ncbi:MAG: LPS export ABC transporter permease LptF [Desulfobacterales bacterium]|nr:LPS export ABC transporter permease LptF [Desulfobacterales bacterium]
MQINTIVNRYILRELIPPFCMNLVFFMFVFLMRQILDITNMIVNYQVSLAVFALMIIYSMPYFLVYIIPMSVMMSVLLTFLRMSADNEITALKAGGVSLYSLMTPVMIFAIAGFLLSTFMAAYGMPWGRTAYERLSVEVVRSNFNVGLKERQFIDSFDGVMMYVNEIDMKSRQMRGVFIEDNRKRGASSTVVAPRGNLFEGEDANTFFIRLQNGVVSQVRPGGKSADAIGFDTYDIRLDMKGGAADVASRSRDEKEMRISELRQYLEDAEKQDKKYYSVLTEMHRKFSIPFACIALSILAMPLGIQTVSARKSAGLGIGLFCFLLYYLLLSGGMVLAETGRWHPVFVLWAPNVIMGALGIYLFVKASKDSPVAMFSGIGRGLDRLRRMLSVGPEDGRSGGPSRGSGGTSAS